MEGSDLTNTAKQWFFKDRSQLGRFGLVGWLVGLRVCWGPFKDASQGFPGKRCDADGTCLQRFRLQHLLDTQRSLQASGRQLRLPRTTVDAYAKRCPKPPEESARKEASHKEASSDRSHTTPSCAGPRHFTARAGCLPRKWMAWRAQHPNPKRSGEVILVSVFHPWAG